MMAEGFGVRGNKLCGSVYRGYFMHEEQHERRYKISCEKDVLSLIKSILDQ